MRWASAISHSGDLERALGEAGEAVRAELDGAPDLIVAFASAGFGPAVRELPRVLGDRLGGAPVIGCTGGGVIGAGREAESRDAVAIAAARMPGVRVSPFHLGSDPEDWPSRIGADPDEVRAVALMPEPFTCDSQHLLAWFDAAFPAATKIGGIASGAREPGGHALFCGDASHPMGAVGVALSGRLEVDAVVAQGCRPIGAPMFVTSAERNVIYAIDGRPAVQVIQELYESLDERDRQLFRHSLFLGLVMRPAQERYGPGDFLIRNLAGIDPGRGAIVVQARVETSQVVQFHLRDAETSAEDLDNVLAAHRQSRPQPPAGALMFSCLGRGMHLYGRADHDTELFRARIGEAPIAGFFCNGEIGPVQGQTFLHGYTSSFGLFYPA